MKQIAVLGPKGTYSDIACQKYINENNLDLEILYYPSILKVSNAIDDNTIAILPFENTLDGFVIESMDQIINKKLHIVAQTKLEIDFAFVTNEKSINDVKKCFVQFKAYGQCLDFISNNSFDVITTQSNMESVLRLSNEKNGFAAIVPMHILDEYNYSLIIPHVADSKANETRFFIVQKDANNITYNSKVNASIVLTALDDYPGLLYVILKEFHKYDINLNAIMSRPMKTEMGKYKFFFECSLSPSQIYRLDEIADILKKECRVLVEILGIYNLIK
ncbi:MAG: hypothetical protein MR357_07755 [Anaeroplasma sp.]|nr:hypothetical protein [Anaeroplasma sp.]